VSKTDVLGKLLKFKFRDVQFPTSNFKLSLRQDLAKHQYPYRDGAFVEATGREALTISARIPFVNTLNQLGFEEWTGDLYPNVYRAFLTACADRTNGVLTHPELGDMIVKVESVETVWDAGTRDGVFVDVSWIEHNPDKDALAKELPKGSPHTAKASFGKISGDLNTFGVKTPPDLIEFGNQLASMPDQLAISTGRIAGKFNRAVRMAQNLERAMNKSPSALQWQTRQAIYSLQNSVADIKKLAYTTKRTIGIYYPPKAATLSAIAVKLGANLSEMMPLNAALLGKPTVPANSPVRYYAS
jgi:hypothetical protein